MIAIFKCNICGIEHRTMQVPKVYEDEELMKENIRISKVYEEEIEKFKEERIACAQESAGEYLQYYEKNRNELLEMEADVIYYNDKWYHFNRKLVDYNNIIYAESAFGETKAWKLKPDSKSVYSMYRPYRSAPAPPFFDKTKYLCCPTCSQKTYVL